MFIENTEILVGMIFGVMGFIIAFFMSRSLNIIIFGGLTYAIFKALEALNFDTNWELFNNFVIVLADLGTSVMALLQGMLDGASDIALILFVFGGSFGLILRKRGT